MKYLYTGKDGKATLQKGRKILGTDHVEIGEKVTKLWSFPEKLVKLISTHHNPSVNKSNDGETKCIYLANILSYLIRTSSRLSKATTKAMTKPIIWFVIIKIFLSAI